MLRINYTNYREFSTQYKKDLSEIYDALSALSDALLRLCNYGVISGTIHDELIIYHGYVKQVIGIVEEVEKTMESLLEKYLDDMNEAQAISGKYILYDKEYPDLRDYTQENFDKMANDCDSTDHDANIFEQINDWGEDVVSTVFNFIGKTFNLFNARQTQFLVMEVNDITVRRLKEIQMRINNCEDKYASKIDKLNNTLDTLNKYLVVLREGIEWKNGEFSASGLSHKITLLYNEMVQTIDEVKLDLIVSDEDILRFLELEYPEKFFSDSSSEIYSYLSDLSEMDLSDPAFWGIIVTQMFGVAQQRLKELFTDYSFEDYLMDKEMLEVLDDMAGREKVYDDTAKEKTVTTLEKLMGLVEEFGDSWGEYLNTLRDENGKLLLDKRTKEYKAFKAFFDQFGSAEKILKYGGDVCEILAKYIVDYDECKEILETLKVKCADDAEMMESLERIGKVYDRSWEAIAKDAFDKVIEYGESYIEKNIDEAFNVSIFKVVGYVEMGIDVGGKITGISEDSLAKMELLATGYDQMNSAKQAYESALIELQSCDSASDNYQQCMKEFEHSFEYYRVTQKRQFERMGKAENGLKGEYYRYCSQELDQLSLNNFEDFKLMTLQEYKNLTA